MPCRPQIGSREEARGGVNQTRRYVSLTTHCPARRPIWRPWRESWRIHEINRRLDAQPDPIENLQRCQVRRLCEEAIRDRCALYPRASVKLALMTFRMRFIQERTVEEIARAAGMTVKRIGFVVRAVARICAEVLADDEFAGRPSC